MTDQDVSAVVRQLADLRLQVNALEVAAKNGSLPEMLKQTRRTILWSAVAVAIALIVSSTFRACSDSRVQALEHRIETLERGTKGL
jgi:hypothetical protein